MIVDKIRKVPVLSREERQTIYMFIQIVRWKMIIRKKNQQIKRLWTEQLNKKLFYFLETHSVRKKRVQVTKRQTLDQFTKSPWLAECIKYGSEQRSNSKMILKNPFTKW